MMSSEMGSNSEIKNQDVNENDAETENVIEEVGSYISQILKTLEHGVEKHNGSNSVRSLKHFPLPPESRSPKEVLAAIEDAVVRLNLSENDDEPSLAVLPDLEETEKLCFVMKSLEYYIQYLDPPHADFLSNWIYCETTDWISQIFRFPGCGALYDDNSLEGLVNLFRILLSRTYETYEVDGFEAFKETKPLIYCTSCNCRAMAQYICKSCGLPERYVRQVPQYTDNDGDDGYMEILRQQFEEDIGNQKTPVLFLEEARTQIRPVKNNIQVLSTICNRYGIWLHITGSNVAALAVLSGAQNLLLADSASVKYIHLDFKNHNNLNMLYVVVLKGEEPDYVADSITISMEPWVNISALPSVILCKKTDDEKMAKTLALRKKSLIQSLPIWYSLQCLGQHSLTEHLRQKFDSCYEFHQQLERYSTVQILSHGPDDANSSFSQHVSKYSAQNNVSFIDKLVISAAITSVAFKFVPEENDAVNSVYIDKLNSWLHQVMSAELPAVRLMLIGLESGSAALLYAPFDNMSVIDRETWDSFYNCLDQQIDVLKATVTQKGLLHDILREAPNMRLVELKDWAGLGGVQYTPPGWEQKMDSERAKNELNRLNMQIVEQLRNTDAAFSAGESEEGVICIRFGMVASDSTVTDLLGLVESVGKQVEDSWIFIDTMAEVVKKGIATAMLDLQKENEDKLWQEGILRHVPVFGNIVNWWSPINKDNGGGIKGRSLDLNAGVIHSTENIYRYHMQGGDNSNVSVKVPIQASPSNSNVVSNQQSDQEQANTE